MLVEFFHYNVNDAVSVVVDDDDSCVEDDDFVVDCCWR